ncbi:transporter substrate-binding domain-containing protein [Kitasatospora viridis]|uniref:Amino acid ABC transporter substrate-binding protein (PAAT family) n=1 Tax=Kitasatospora viridis TaxID=281105 RepID=A0A561TT36_9ACTN|nr:transporter substrate-binding domain-containing protein [Kitasatospora viridis]TWF90286.1 amino acid ABC transporter substrate-binding protein (PAAT family) [Kitasatospora viridis]
MAKMRVRARCWGTALGAVLLVAACGSVGGSVGGPAPAAARSATPGAGVSAPPAVPADDTGCDPTRSVPPSATATGPEVDRILKQGYLTVGVDQNAYHWGARDPITGQLEGFDIDLVHAIANALVGDHPGNVHYVSTPAADRIPALQQRRVDLVVRAMAITCQRRTQVGMSTVYFQTGHQAVVGAGSPAKTLDQALRGKRVCITSGSNEQDEIAQDSHGAAAVVFAVSEVDCLVQLQLGKVDAVFTDAAYGSSLVAQDATVRLVDHPYGTKYFGVATNLGDTDLLARVNQVLEDYRKGPWQASYAHWLAPYLGPSAGPPAAAYLPH